MVNSPFPCITSYISLVLTLQNVSKMSLSRKFVPLSLILFLSLELWAQPCGTFIQQDEYSSALQRSMKIDWLRNNYGLEEFRSTMTFDIQVYMVEQDKEMRSHRIDQLYDAVAGMNEVYAAAQIRFNVYPTIEIIKNPDYFDFHKNNEGLLTTAYQRPGMINLYLVNSITMPQYDGQIAGYAYMPGGPERLIISMSYVSDGTTLIHEMGHFFGLIHTHGPQFESDELVNGSNCHTSGDLICDTPADPNIYGHVNHLCEYTGRARDANNQKFQPMVSNFMSYAPARCCNSFTPGQLDVMKYHAQFVRNHLGRSDADPLLALSAEELFRRGIASKEPTQQIVWYTRALQNDRFFAEAYFNRAQTYYSIDEPMLALQDAHSYLDLERNYKGFMLRGNIYDRLNKTKEAIGDFEAALFLRPASAEAAQALNRLMERPHPEPVATLNAEGSEIEQLFSRAFATSNLNERASLFTQALEIDPQNAPALGSRSLTYLQLGRLEEAMSDIQLALSLYKHKSFYHTRGLINNAMQNYRQAVQDFDNALILDPAYHQAMQSRQQTIRTMETRRMAEEKTGLRETNP